MSSKLSYIPYIPHYQAILNKMEEDLEYRKQNRLERTLFGQNLYLRTNVQIITTKACPYNCYFCIDKINPLQLATENKEAQLKSLEKVISADPNIRLTITGGEPTLDIEHIKRIMSVFSNSNKVAAEINTTGYNPLVCDISGLKVKLSYNECVQPDLNLFKGYTLQTVIKDTEMNGKNLINFMNTHNKAKSYNFRFLTEIGKDDYNIDIWNELQNSSLFEVINFRIGDFFVYANFTYKNKFASISLGDMTQQKKNDYGDGYSNIIIHPDGRIGLNWR